MFDQFISTICTYAAIKAGCQESFKAIGAQTNIAREMDESEREIVKVTTKEAYNLIGKKTIEYSIVTGFVTNSVITKTIQIQAPFKPIANEIQFNGSEMNPNVSPNWTLNINWKWELE